MTGTAELIARANAFIKLMIDWDKFELGAKVPPKFDCDAATECFEQVVKLVAAQAQEIERLKTALTADRNRIEDDAHTIDRHVAKIGKLQNTLIGREG